MPGRRALRVRGAWAERRIRRPSRLPPPRLPEVVDQEAAHAVGCIVISKDRPLQLDACLRSLDQFWPYAGPRTVIYKASDDPYAEGYRVLAGESTVDFIAETKSLRRHVLGLLARAPRYAAFFMDDDLMFQRPQAAVVPPEGFAAVSLRLGLNTTISYADRSDQSLPEFVRRPPLIAWDWTTAEFDFGYPLSLDGSVFDTALLRRLLVTMRFKSPNQLEEQMHVRRDRVPRWMLACEHSSLVNIPANIVTETHTNRAGTDPEMSPEALNARFLDGERIDLQAMDFSDIVGAHQDIPVISSNRPG